MHAFNLNGLVLLFLFENSANGVLLLALFEVCVLTKLLQRALYNFTLKTING